MFPRERFRTLAHNSPMSKNKPQQKGFANWIHIFSSGTHTDSSGQTRDFTNDDLDDIVNNHRPAPLVIGHPKHNDPSYGWTGSLKREGTKLFMKTRDVNPLFAKAVENKAFPERSVSLRETNNGLQLRHVGWLGAVPPALKNLDALAFTELDATPCDFNDESSEVMEFVSPMAMPNALNVVGRLMRNLRDHLIGSDGLETANQVIPSYDLEWFSDNASELRDAANKNNQSLFNETQPAEDNQTMTQYTEEEMNKIKQQAADDAKKAAAAEFAEKEAKLKDELDKKDKAAALKEHTDFADSLVKEGKLLPAEKSGFIAFCSSMTTESPLEFSDADGAEQKTTNMQWLKDFMSSAKPKINFGEQADGEADQKSNQEVARQISDYSEKHGVSIAEAANAISNQQ